MFLLQAGCALNKKGFTLIELLVAASLFLIAVIAFNFVLKVGSLSINNAQQLNHAVYTIQSKKEEVKKMPFADLPSINGKKFAGGAGKIKVIPALADLVAIELQLEWNPKKIPLKISTLRSKYD